jgi:excisionase family DNA binding protein
MNTSNQMPADERLYTVDEAAEVLRTSPRFIRRLVTERRIEFVKLGRHVRIRESALRNFIESGIVEPMTLRDYPTRRV